MVAWPGTPVDGTAAEKYMVGYMVLGTRTEFELRTVVRKPKLVDTRRESDTNRDLSAPDGWYPADAPSGMAPQT